MSPWLSSVTATRAAQVVPLSPIESDFGDVDFCVKVNDEVPTYVYDIAPLRLWPSRIESP